MILGTYNMNMINKLLIINNLIHYLMLSYRLFFIVSTFPFFFLLIIIMDGIQFTIDICFFLHPFFINIFSFFKHVLINFLFFLLLFYLFYFSFFYMIIFFLLKIIFLIIIKILLVLL